MARLRHNAPNRIGISTAPRDRGYLIATVQCHSCIFRSLHNETILCFSSGRDDPSLLMQKASSEQIRLTPSSNYAYLGLRALNAPKRPTLQ